MSGSRTRCGGLRHRPGRCIALHAEANALLYAGVDGGKGSTLYLTTNPCDGCMRLIDAAGIVRVVWIEIEDNDAAIARGVRSGQDKQLVKRQINLVEVSAFNDDGRLIWRPRWNVGGEL